MRSDHRAITTVARSRRCRPRLASDEREQRRRSPRAATQRIGLEPGPPRAGDHRRPWNSISPAVGSLMPGDDVEERRLAGPVRADQADDRVLRDVKSMLLTATRPPKRLVTLLGARGCRSCVVPSGSSRTSPLGRRTIPTRPRRQGPRRSAAHALRRWSGRGPRAGTASSPRGLRRTAGTGTGEVDVCEDRDGRLVSETGLSCLSIDDWIM